MPMSPRYQLIAALAAAVAIAPFTTAPITAPATALASDAIEKDSFAKAVLSANKFEIDSSKRVLEKSASDDVKTFAEQMIADHTKTGEQLWNVTSRQGDMPKAASADDEPPAVDLSSKDAAALKLLEGKDGAEFQAANIDAQDKAHREAVDLFRAYASHSDDEALAAFASKTLPVLEMQLDHITESLQAIECRLATDS